jgi:phosphoheptose isomerase
MHQLSVAIAEAYKRGNKVLICGNGGLAAESEHFAAELMGKYGRDIFIPCISLTGPSALITALANDIGFENVFSHQVKTLGKPGDLVIGMTTSKSPNILKTIHTASEMGLDWQILDRINMNGESVAEVQNNIIKFLHEVALEAKELCVEDAVRQPE